MKNKILKKSLSVFLSFLMVLTSLVFVVPEIAPEVEAASAASYPVTLNFNLNKCADGGHIFIYYYPVNADGTLDKTNDKLYYTFMNSLQAYSSKSNQTFTAGDSGDNRPSGDGSKSTGNIPGWPYKVLISTNGSADIQMRSIKVGNKVVLSTSTQWSCKGNERAFETSGTYDNISADWPEPTVTQITGNSTDITLNLTEGTNYANTYYTRQVTLYDQYGRQFPVTSGVNWSRSLVSSKVTGDGLTDVTVETLSIGSGISEGRIIFGERVQENLPNDSTNGQLVYKFTCAYGSIKSECNVTVNCPKYKASYVKANGTTALTVDAGYYGNSYSSSATATANTQTAYDGTNHTVYSWPKQTYSVTGPITINEKATTNTHTYGNWSAAGDVNHSHACTVCGYSVEEAHNFGNWVSVDSANHKKTCQTATCGHVVTAPHNMSAWKTDGDGKDATHTRICEGEDGCGYKETTPHTWDSGVETKAPSCATDGVRTYTCTDPNCDATYTEAIPKTNAHVYGDVYTNVDTDGNGTLDSHRQKCVNGDPNCTATKDTAHSYGAWTYADETNHVRTCTVCNLPTAKETHAHSWDEGVVTTAPDCVTDGVRTFTCTECKGTKTAVEPKTGHNWGNYEANADGVTHKRTCQVKGCGVTEASADCSFTHYSTTQQADCTKNEIRAYACDYCANIKTVEGGTTEGDILGLAKASGHNWLDCTVDDAPVDRSEYLARAATCDKSAIYYFYCGTCGAKSNVENYNQTAAILGDKLITEDTRGSNVVYFSGEPKLGHDYSSGIAVTNNDRTHSFRCVRYAECSSVGVGNVEDDTVKCSTTCSSTVIAPTCTAAGYTAYSCDVCQNKWQADETPMADHRWASTGDEAELVNFVRKSEADCVNKAVYYKNCSVCDQSAETIDATQIFTFGDALGHKYGAWVSNGVDADGEGTHTRTCTVCEEADNFEGRTETKDHEWTFDKTISAPSWGVAGEDQYKCTACGATKIVATESQNDDVYPTGKISWGATGWEKFLETISFGLYTPNDVTLAISASDVGSGVKSVEYYKSEAALTLAAVKAVTDWEEYVEGALTIPAKNAKQFVVYAKITDNAGNVTYLSTDGIVFDTVAPVISVTGAGADNVYCEEVTISFSDANLDSDTRRIGYFLNGAYMWTDADGIVKDEPVISTVGKYKVVVSDKAGNNTSVEFEVVAHDYAEIVLADNSNLVSEANCTDKAVYKKVCSNCGDVSETEIFEHGEVNSAKHKDIQEVAEQASTCQVQGWDAYDKCLACRVVTEEGGIPYRALAAHVFKTYTQDEVVDGNYTHTAICDTCKAEDGEVATDTLDCSGGTATCTEAAICVTCKEAWGEALGHTMQHTARKEAGCGTEGNIEYWTCTTTGGCGKTYSDAEGETEVSAADTVIPALSHTLVKTDAVAPDCDTDGNIAYWTCTTVGGCGKIFADEGATDEITAADTVDPKTGHTPLDAVEENYKKATCGVAGSYELVVYCDVCGEEISRVPQTIPALSHTLVKTDAVAPDCYTDGNIAYWTCTTADGCGKIYADEGATDEITPADTVDPKTGHKTELVPAVDADCLTDGTIAHYVCLNGCGKLFSDAEATDEITDISGEPALNHDFTGAWSYSVTEKQHQRQCSRCDAWTELEDCTFAEGYSPITNEGDIHTHKALCECGNAKTEVCTAVKGETHEDPTCGDSSDYGWTDYSCALCSNEWEGDIVYVLHNLELKEKVDGDCRTEGYITYKCTNDGCDYEVTQNLGYGTAHVGDPDALTRVTIENVKTATCASGGYTGDIVCECGDILRKGTATQPDPNDHFWGNPVIQSGTCVIEGYQVLTCEDCGEKKTDSIGVDPNNHVNVIAGQDVEPTCTEFGYKGATVCEDCGAVVKEGAPVNPLGHKISPWMVITMPSDDGKTPGYAERYCLRCGGEREPRNDFYYDDLHYVVYHNDNGVRLTAPRYYIEGDYTLRPEKNPVKQEDDKYTYEFIGWNYSDDELNFVEKQMAVIAQYKAIEKSYKVTFYDANGKVIPVEGIAGKDILFSEIAKAYTGATPTKPATAEYTYKFKGWNIKCDYVTGEAKVIPEFEAIPVEKEEEDDDGIFGWFIRWIKSILAKLGIKF